jgi:WD40 repeat protein
MPDGTRLLSGADSFIRQWDSSTWTQVSDRKIHTGHPVLAVNCNGTIVASTVENHIRLWRLSDWRTIAIFQHSDSPRHITFSMDGKHILAGSTNKISEWAVPEHAWPENASKHQAIYQDLVSDPVIFYLIRLMPRLKTVIPRLKALTSRLHPLRPTLMTFQPRHVSANCP